MQVLQTTQPQQPEPLSRTNQAFPRATLSQKGWGSKARGAWDSLLSPNLTFLTGKMEVTKVPISLDYCEKLNEIVCVEHIA